jgi:PAS domain-containing protein
MAPRARSDPGRRPLRAVEGASVAPSIAFCARCGAPPPDGGRLKGSRVCQRCCLGLVLRASADVAPEPDEAFLVIDPALTISALSLRAERLLAVSETAAVGRPLSAFVTPAAEGFEAALRAAASNSAPNSRRVEHVLGWAGGAGGPPRRMRVGPCEPPPAAVLVVRAGGS